MRHSRGAPYHPQTQGKIERWHQTLKNRILLENYFLPGDLKHQIEAFVIVALFRRIVIGNTECFQRVFVVQFMILPG